jgi:hypothetical protein
MPPSPAPSWIAMAWFVLLRVCPSPRPQPETVVLGLLPLVYERCVLILAPWWLRHMPLECLRHMQQRLGSDLPQVCVEGLWEAVAHVTQHLASFFDFTACLVSTHQTTAS